MIVGGTGLEPATSAMSTQRSEPTELTALAVLKNPTKKAGFFVK